MSTSDLVSFFLQSPSHSWYKRHCSHYASSLSKLYLPGSDNCCNYSAQS